MAARYWVGGSATWDGTAGSKWATTSGGAGGASAPTSADDVYFDAGSGSVSVTWASGAVARSIDCNGFTGTITHSSITLSIGDGTAGAGDIALRLAAGVAVSSNGNFSFVSTSSTQQTIYTAGVALRNLTCNGAGGSWILGDSLSMQTLTVTAGSFDSGNQSMTCGSISSTGSGVRSVTLGTSTVTLTGGGSILTLSGSNLTWSAGSSTLDTGTANSGCNCTLGGYSFGTILLRRVITSPTGNVVTVNGNGTIATLTCSGIQSLQIQAGVTLTVGDLSFTGQSASAPMKVNSTSNGTRYTLSVGTSWAATQTRFQDANVQGAQSPVTPGTGCVDGRNNLGILFPPWRYNYAIRQAVSRASFF